MWSFLVRVPVGCLEQVRATIALYRGKEVDGKALFEEQKTKKKKRKKIQHPDLQDITAAFDRLPRNERRAMIKIHGSKDKAISAFISGLTPPLKQTLRAGKLAQIVLNELYSDGNVPEVNGKLVKYLYRDNLGELYSWSGLGRRPKWFKAYLSDGGEIDDIKLYA